MLSVRSLQTPAVSKAVERLSLRHRTVLIDQQISTTATATNHQTCRGHDAEVCMRCTSIGQQVCGPVTAIGLMSMLALHNINNLSHSQLIHLCLPTSILFFSFPFLWTPTSLLSLLCRLSVCLPPALACYLSCRTALSNESSGLHSTL